MSQLVSLSLLISGIILISYGFYRLQLLTFFHRRSDRPDCLAASWRYRRDHLRRRRPAAQPEDSLTVLPHPSRPFMKTQNTKFTIRLLGLLTTGVLLTTVAVSTSGCFAVAAGAGAGAAVAYVRGDLDTTLNAGFEKSVRAANNAIDQLKYAKVSELKDAQQATLIARNAADKKIELYLEKITDDATKLKIRVGTFGDDALQQDILNKVKSNL